jgi:tRNA A-37 threonylcarbamoyl transferase component Bud32
MWRAACAILLMQSESFRSTRYTTFLGRQAEVLAMSKRGDGSHRVLKIEYQGKPVVVKCYGLKGSRLQALSRQFGSRLLLGKSTYTARGRYATERAVLELWRREGFDTPRVLDIPELAGAGQPCLAMEFVPGELMSKIIRSADVPLSRKKELVARFAETAGRRHGRAIELAEPGLIFKHPTFSHIIVSDDRLFHFDFEQSLTHAGSLERYIRHEIAGFLHALPRSDRALFSELFTAFSSSYPGRQRLDLVISELQRFGTVPLARWLEPCGGLFLRFKRYEKMARLARSFAAAPPAG